MSTVTLSKPHCAIISAEKPEGIASHALTTALPDFQISLTLFATLPSFFVLDLRHHDERRDSTMPLLARTRPPRYARDDASCHWQRRRNPSRRADFCASAAGHFERKNAAMSMIVAARSRISAFTPRHLPPRPRRALRDFVRAR